MGVEFSQLEFTGYTRTPVRVGFDVVSNGSLDASAVDVTVNALSPISLASVSAQGGTCSTAGNVITCHLAGIASGQRRRIELDVTGQYLGRFSGEVVVTSTGDADAENDHATFDVVLSPATDASITAEQPVVRTVLSGTEFEIAYQVRVDGRQGLSSASIQSNLNPFTVLSATTQSGSCSISTGFVICNFSAIGVGQMRRVVLRIRADAVGSYGVGHYLSGDIDDTPNNNSASHDIRVDPLVDFVVRADSAPEHASRGTPIEASFTLLSLGPRAATDAEARIYVSSQFRIITLTAQDATCVASDPNNQVCSFNNPVESGGSRQVVATLVAETAGQGSISMEAYSPVNQHYDGPLSNYAGFLVDVREEADVSIEAQYDGQIYDNKPFEFRRRIRSYGFMPAENVTYSLPLPQGFSALSTEISSITNAGTCTITATAVNCALGTLASDGVVQLTIRLQSDRLGNFTLTPTADASNDADPTNNSAPSNLQVLANVDIRLDVLSELRIVAGRPTRQVLTVRTASHPVQDASVALMVFGVGVLQITPITASQGNCVLEDGSRINCQLGEIAANSSASIEVEFLGSTTTVQSVEIAASCLGDVDHNNGYEVLQVVISPQADAFVSAAAPTVHARAGASFSLPLISAKTTADIEDVVLQVRVPDGLSIESATPVSGECTLVSAGAADCNLGNFENVETRDVRVVLRAARAGSFDAAIELTASDDLDSSNNRTSVTVVIDDAPSTSGGGGGGGGGSLDWTSLGLGVAVLALRRRRNLAASARHAGQVHSGRCPDGPSHC